MRFWDSVQVVDCTEAADVLQNFQKVKCLKCGFLT